MLNTFNQLRSADEVRAWIDAHALKFGFFDGWPRGDALHALCDVLEHCKYATEMTEDIKHMKTQWQLGVIPRLSPSATTTSYRVVTHGLRIGMPFDHAVAQLVAVFKRNDEQMRALLAASSAIVKKNLDLAGALRYKEALERCGCVCVIESEAQAMPAPPRPATSPPTEQKYDDAMLRWLQYNKMDPGALQSVKAEPAELSAETAASKRANR